MKEKKKIIIKNKVCAPFCLWIFIFDMGDFTKLTKIFFESGVCEMLSVLETRETEETLWREVCRRRERER